MLVSRIESSRNVELREYLYHPKASPSDIFSSAEMCVPMKTDPGTILETFI